MDNYENYSYKDKFKNVFKSLKKDANNQILNNFNIISIVVLISFIVLISVIVFICLFYTTENMYFVILQIFSYFVFSLLLILVFVQTNKYRLSIVY